MPRSKRAREKPISVYVAMFRLTVLVFIGWTPSEIIRHGIRCGVDKKRFTQRWVTALRDAHMTAVGYCSHYGAYGNADVIIWLKDRPAKASEYGVLWHELSHAVDRIAEHCDPGNRFDDGHGMSEPRAFLYEFLALGITQVLWNPK